MPNNSCHAWSHNSVLTPAEFDLVLPNQSGFDQVDKKAVNTVGQR